MRGVFGLVLVIGMGLAGFAVFMVKGYMSDQKNALALEKARAQAIVKTVDVIAVKDDFVFGDTITADDVTVIKHAQAHLPEGTFDDIAALFPEGSDGKRMLVLPLIKNEPVLVSKLTAPGQTAGITHQLRPQMRGFTINVDVTSGVAGFLRPGSFVDIYWTGNVNGPRSGSQGSTHLIGRSIELIAVDQSTDRNQELDGAPRTVTVQVSNDDVKSLTQAQESGKMSLALVGSDWAEMRKPDGVAAITMPEPDAAPVMVADAPPPETRAECYRTERRGTEKVQIPIACN